MIRQPVPLNHYQPLYDAFAASQLQPRSGMRAFVVRFDNSKKRGRGKHAECHQCEGVVFSSGRVCLDTDAVQRGYTSIGEMEEQLGKYGNVSIEWMRLEDAE